MPEATSNAPLTVVLVHGAFADSSSWDGVIERLQDAGTQVTAPPNPLRGISEDSAYVASFMRQVPGPVLAVGHSYGGAVISNAPTGLANVVRRVPRGGGRAPRRRERRVARQCPGDRAGRAAVPDRRRRGDGHRVRDRSGKAA